MTTDGAASGLDQLISEVESEAARRRAGPGYPYDLEARIEAQLARQAPAPSGRVSLEGLVTAVQEASVISIDAPVNASRREYAYVKTVLKRGLAWYLRHIADQVSSLGYATARTLRAITVDLEDTVDDVHYPVFRDAGKRVKACLGATVERQRRVGNLDDEDGGHRMMVSIVPWLPDDDRNVGLGLAMLAEREWKLHAKVVPGREDRA